MKKGTPVMPAAAQRTRIPASPPRAMYVDLYNLLINKLELMSDNQRIDRTLKMTSDAKIAGKLVTSKLGQTLQAHATSDTQ